MKTMVTLLGLALLAASEATAQVNLVNQSTTTQPSYLGRYDNVIWSSVFVVPKDRHLSTQPWVNVSDPHAGQRVFGNPVTDETGLVLFSWGPHPKPNTRLNADRTLHE